MHVPLSVTTKSPAETKAVAAALAPELTPGDTISLSGDLGAGKTVFVQGLASGLGVAQRVTSPTFTIVHEYAGHYPVLHLDVYRLSSFQEVLDLGFEELSDPTAILIIEWGEAVAPLLPHQRLNVEIQMGGRDVGSAAPDVRVLTFWPRGGRWTEVLGHMRSTAETLLRAAGPPIPPEERWSVPPDQSVREYWNFIEPDRGN